MALNPTASIPPAADYLGDPRTACPLSATGTRIRASKAVWCGVVAGLLATWLISSLVRAQPAGDAVTPAAAGSDAVTPSPEGQALTYGNVDAAVVRIFSLGNVETQRVQGRVVARDIALPSGGHGSGLLVSSRGLVVTAKHVVEHSHVVVVRIPGDSRVYPAVVVFTDPDHDVAVLRIPHGDYATVPLPTGAVPLRVRQTVDAIGYPLDPTRVQPQSSRGIIAGLLPDGELQLDMSVNPGNSGGPLMDEEGRIVGIVVARGRLDRGVEGIAVAEPLPVVQAALAHAGAPHWSDAAVAAPGVPRLVDLLIRMGPLGAIHDVVDDLDQPALRIRQLERVVGRVHDADLMVVAAAYLWDAAMVVLESQDGAPEPRHVRDAHARVRALALMRKARALAARALAVDAGVGERSPFARQIQTGGASRAAARGATSAAWENPFTQAAHSSEDANRFVPLLVMGAAYDTGGIHGPTGGGTLLQPIFTGAYSARIRGVVFLGVSSQYGRGPDEETYFVAGELGAGVRLGYPGGIFLGVSWMPAILRYLAPYHASSPFRPDPVGVPTNGTLVTAAGGSVKFGVDIYHFVVLGQLAILKGSSSVPGFTNWSISIGHGF